MEDNFTCYQDYEEELYDRMSRHREESLTKEQIEEMNAMDWWFMPESPRLDKQ